MVRDSFRAWPPFIPLPIDLKLPLSRNAGRAVPAQAGRLFKRLRRLKAASSDTTKILSALVITARAPAALPAVDTLAGDFSEMAPGDVAAMGPGLATK